MSSATGVYKFDSQGKFVPLAYYSFFEDGPIALGWLRASHRRELKLKQGEIVPLEIEIWPSGTRFESGERLKLIVQGTDLQKYSTTIDPIYARHEDSVNSGRHVIHTGGQYDSYLLVPVVPQKPE